MIAWDTLTTARGKEVINLSEVDTFRNAVVHISQEMLKLTCRQGWKFFEFFHFILFFWVLLRCIFYMFHVFIYLFTRQL